MEISEHKGHLITLDVSNRGKGWTWTYQVGSGPVIANVGAPHLSEALARLEAVAVVEREIDRALTPRVIAPAPEPRSRTATLRADPGR
jgi:hypothetical protein